MENDIQKISLEVESKTSGASDGLLDVAESLELLVGVLKPATRHMKELSGSLDSLKRSAQNVNKINFQGVSTNLNNFANTLNNINNSVKGFSSMGAQMKDMSSGLNSMRKSFESLGSVAPSLNKIKLNGFSGELSKITSLVKLSDDMGKMRTAGKDFSVGINAFSRSADKLPDLINKINSLDLKDFKIQVKDLSESLKILSQSIEGVNVASKSMVNSMGKLPTTVSKMNKAVRSKGVSNNNAFFSNATNILSSYYMFKQLAYVLGQPIRKANDFIETMNLFNVVMGESNKQASEFVTNLESIGVDWEQAMRYQSSFYDIGKSLGMVSKNAYTVSEQFTKLAYDYASLYNLNVEDSFQKLQAALVGTVEPIRRLGKDISIAKLEEVALSLGIEKSVRAMNQAERAELRFIAVMQQSASAMNDMERTINQPANALRVLKAQFTSLSREIGSLFIPMLTSILPYLIAVVKLIREITQSIMALFGVKLFELDFKQISQPLGVADAYTDDMADNLDRGAKSAKKIKDYMIGIDELNVLNTDTGAVERDTGAAGIGSPIGGGLGLDLEKYGYEEVLKSVQSKADAIYQMFRKWKKPLMIAAGILATIWSVGKIMKFINALKGVGKVSTFVMGVKGIAGIGKVIGKLVKPGGLLTKGILAFSEFGSSILLSLGVFSNSALLTSIVGLAAVLVPLGVAIAGVTYALKPAVKQMDEFKGMSEKTTEKLKPIITTWKELEMNLNELDWTDKVISDEDVENNVSKVKDMVQQVLNEVSSDRNEELKNLELLRDMNIISEETYNERKAKLNGYYDDIQKSTENAEETIRSILESAAEGKRELTDEEVKMLDEAYKTIRDNAINTMSESEKEQMLIMSRLSHNSVALNVESAAEILKNAKKNKEDLIKEAENTKDEMLNQLELRFATSKDMTEEEYQEELKNINDLYNAQVSAAEQGYKDINEKIKKGLGEGYKYIDEKTGEIKSKWGVFMDGLHTKATEQQEEIRKSVKNFFTKCGDVTKEGIRKLKDLMDFDWHLPKLKMPHFSVTGEFNFKKIPPKVPKVSVKWYARGGFVPDNASFVSPENLWTAGEAGREVVGNYAGKKTVMPLEDTGFVQAMYRAVKEGVKEAMDTSPIYVNVTSKAELDGKDIYENQQNYQYTIGTSMLKMV